MTTYTVYADILFLINFLLDFILLYAVSRFGAFHASKKRLFFASLAGAVYGVLLVFPSLQMLGNFFFKLLASFLIVRIAFPRLTRRKYMAAVAYFYLISFAMAGAVIGGTALLKGMGFADAGFTFTAATLVFALLICLALSKWGVDYVKKNFLRNSYVEVIDIHFNGKSARVNALIDTGNELVDPISKKPVIVAEFDAVRDLLPFSLQDAFMRHGRGDVARILTDLMEKSIVRSLRLVPFSSIGKANGLLLGFKPELVLIPDRGHCQLEDTVVCLYWGKIHTRDDCRCIINPAIFDLI